MDIQVFDNGGKTRDRYCLIVDNRKVYTMDGEPLSEPGVTYLCDIADLDRIEAGRSIKLDDLPEALTKAILIHGNIWFGAGKAADTAKALGYHTRVLDQPAVPDLVRPDGGRRA